MFIRPFGYERAGSLADACEMLRERGEAAKVIAGGQSLLPMVNLGLVQPEVIIDISHAGRDDDGAAARGGGAVPGGAVPGGGRSGSDRAVAARSREIGGGDGYLTIGALVSHARLAGDPAVASAQPLLAAAAARIGNPRVRSRGTLGGSLAHSDPAAELPLAMVALGASYRVTDGRSARDVRAEEFHLSFLTSALAEDELVVSATVPALGPGWGWSFQEVARREGDFALAAVAVLVRMAGGIVAEARVAVGGAADRPLRLADVEAALAGASPGEIAGRAGPLRGLSPVSDISASAGHRAHLCAVLVRRALDEACRRSQEATA